MWLSLSRLKTLNSNNLGGPPHPVIVAIRDSEDYTKVVLYSHYTTITGWGVLLTKNDACNELK